jgi:hypothetical protein
MIIKETPSYPISIFMAGDIAAATDYARQYCDENGLCVTITPTSYIYTSGQEAGFIVGLINYPRFPATPEELWATAETVAAYLRERLYQDSYTIQAPDKTVWISHREQPA